ESGATYKEYHTSPYLAVNNLVDDKGIKPLDVCFPDRTHTQLQKLQYNQLTHFLQTGQYPRK
ncbi:Hypothetical predicted protein, partial [Pelobates cultripes]